MMPDYAAAVVAHLREDSAFTAIVPAGRIVMEIPNAANMPQSWVLVRKSGGLGSFDSHPYHGARLDIHSYGANGYEAFRVSRAVQATLIPADRKSTRIHAHDCVIAGVGMESGHVGLETQEGWPFLLTVYALTVYEVPVVIPEEVPA